LRQWQQIGHITICTTTLDAPSMIGEKIRYPFVRGACCQSSGRFLPG
jgi:hypothetical protein